MTVDNEMAIKLHGYYMNHKTMWLKIADILRTDSSIIGKIITMKRYQSAYYTVNWLKRQALKTMKSVASRDNDYCFCCQAHADFGDLCYLNCIIDWCHYSCVSTGAIYVNFEGLIHEIVPKDDYKEDSEKLAKMAEEIANLPFRYQEDYDRAMKEGVN